MAKAKPNPKDRKWRGKHTNAEVNRITDLCVQLLRQRILKSLIKAQLKHQWGLKPRTVEWYLARARLVIAKEAKKSPAQFKNDALAFYESIVSDPSKKITERMAAQANIDKIMAVGWAKDDERTADSLRGRTIVVLPAKRPVEGDDE